MRILYLCPDYGIPVLGHKGASVHVRGMIAAMERAGHEIVLVSPLEVKSPWDRRENISGKFIHLPASDDILNCIDSINAYVSKLEVDSSLGRDVRRILYDRYLESYLLRRFVKSPPDVIYVRGSLHTLAPLTLANTIGRPLLVEINSPLADEHDRYRAGATGNLAMHAERRLLRDADAVLVVSKSLENHAITSGVAPERVHMIPNAVDPILFHPAPRSINFRSQFGIGDGPILGFVGGLRPWHGVNILPDLLHQLVQDFPCIQMVIVGDGPLRESLEHQFTSLGIRERVIFTGAIPNSVVAGVIREFDIAVAPYSNLSHEFYFSPLKLFEYMACGVAVVAADLGQINEVINNGSTGLLYPAGDLDKLIDCCRRILFDPTLQEQLGNTAAQTVKQNYTWDHNLERVINILISLSR